VADVDDIGVVTDGEGRAAEPARPQRLGGRDPFQERVEPGLRFVFTPAAPYVAAFFESDMRWCAPRLRSRNEAAPRQDGVRGSGTRF